MEIWEAVSSMREFEDFKVIKADVPEYDGTVHENLLSLCRDNVCGRYGTNWGCPPGFSEDVETLYSQYSYVLILRRMFCLDVKDQEVVDAASIEMQRKVRMFITELRSNGIDCRGFADGGCKYCGVCSYPDECRYPEAMMGSVSALGLDLKSYLAGIGECFSFTGTCLTLYALVFVK